MQPTPGEVVYLLTASEICHHIFFNHILPDQSVSKISVFEPKEEIQRKVSKAVEERKNSREKPQTQKLAQISLVCVNSRVGWFKHILLAAQDLS